LSAPNSGFSPAFIAAIAPIVMLSIQGSIGDASTAAAGRPSSGLTFSNFTLTSGVSFDPSSFPVGSMPCFIIIGCSSAGLSGRLASR
jgi:hypothetical protein